MLKKVLFIFLVALAGLWMARRGDKMTPLVLDHGPL